MSLLVGARRTLLDRSTAAAVDPTPIVLFDNSGAFLASGTSHSASITSTATAGWTVVAWILWGGGVGNTLSAVAGNSETWTAGTKNTSPTANINVQSFMTILTSDWTPAEAFTFTTSGAGAPAVVIVAYPSGIALDVNPAGSSGSGTTISQTLTGMGTAPLYASACYSTGSNIGTFGTPATWTLLSSVISGAFGMRVFSKALSTSSNDTTFSVTGTSTNWTVNYRTLRSSV